MATAGNSRLHVSKHPLVQHKVTLLSDTATDSPLFRELTCELTQLLVYEATADLAVRLFDYETPMETATGVAVATRLGLVPILRAGLGMVEGATNLLPLVMVYHLGIYRDHDSHEPVSYYNKLPRGFPCDLMLMLDPMLATGGSACAAASALKDRGATAIKFVGIIAAPEGVAHLNAEHPDIDIHVARLDRELDENKYIRPGLGDAGDRLFGT